MNYHESQPAAWVKPVVRCFWALEYEGNGASEPELVLPDGCPEIVFNLSDRFVRVQPETEELQPRSLFAGQMSRSITIRPSGKVDLFGVRLQPAGAWSLLNFPVNEITDQIAEFGLVTGRDGNELEEMLNRAASFDDRVLIFQNWVRSRLSRNEAIDEVASNASTLISASCGSLQISDLATRMGTSERRLERHFKRSIGLSPKSFSRIVRFQSVVRSVQKSPTAGLLDTGLDFGYFDHSHLIREFREFSGITPQAYFDRTHPISDMFTGAE